MTIHPDDIDRWVKQVCEAFEGMSEAIDSSAPTDDAIDRIGAALERIATVMEKGSALMAAAAESGRVVRGMSEDV